MLERFPVEDQMEDGNQQEEQCREYVYRSQMILRQAHQFPVYPIRHPSMGHQIEHHSGDQQNQEIEGDEKGG